MNDAKIRLAALSAARALVARWGDAVPYSELVKGFVVDGQAVRLMSKAEGVFKPAQMTRGVLSVSSRLKAHYTDEPVSGGVTG